MDLKIIDKRDNPLLSRKELCVELSFFGEATPKKDDIKKKIGSSEKADEKLVVVKDVSGEFGNGKGKAVVYVYNSEKELKDIEPKKKEKKKAAEGAAKAPKAEEKKGAKEEKPEAEAKEEPKKEAPKEEGK